METTPPAAPSPTSIKPAARLAWALLILATLYVCYFSHLGALGFVGPDEPRYAWIARDMAETGDWVTPRLYGKPWFEKPVLFYWAAALSFKLFGVSEAAARLPSAIFALLATLALAWLALRLYGAETALWLLLLLPTTVGMIGFSHAAATDMPFSAMLTIAMVCAAYLLRLVPSAGFSIHTPKVSFYSDTGVFSLLIAALFGFFLGLAVLAKGPAAIVLSGGAVFFWALFTKRWRDAFRILHPVAIASFCFTALPWYILCARRNPDFFRIFIIEHNFKRYLTPEFQHIQPFWFYVPILIVGFLPWTLILVGLAADAVRSLRKHTWLNSTNLFFACGTVFPILFFSLSKSKLPGYVLPAIPFLVLPLAQRVSLCERKIIAGDRWIAITSGATLIVLAFLAILQSERIPFTWPALALTAGGFTAVFLGGLRRVSLALKVAQLAVLLTLYSALVGDGRAALDSSVSARYAFQTTALAWNNFAQERASTFKLQRSFQYSLNFYFHRELPEWSPDSVKPGWVFTSNKEASQLRALGLDCRFSSLIRAVIVCEDPGSADPRPRSGQFQ